MANRPGDPQYILDLVAQGIRVSLETTEIIRRPPPIQTGQVMSLAKASA